MTEKTVTNDLLFFAGALGIAPSLTSILLILVSFFVPGVGIWAFISVFAVGFGFSSYVILGGPFMWVAHYLGLHHPIFHAVIGYGAVMLIPFAYSIGLPVLNDPTKADFGIWFGPAWCACSAFIFNICRNNNERNGVAVT